MTTTSWKGAPECRNAHLFAFKTSLRDHPPEHVPEGYAAAYASGRWQFQKIEIVPAKTRAKKPYRNAMETTHGTQR